MLAKAKSADRLAFSAPDMNKGSPVFVAGLAPRVIADSLIGTALKAEALETGAAAADSAAEKTAALESADAALHAVASQPDPALLARERQAGFEDGRLAERAALQGALDEDRKALQTLAASIAANLSDASRLYRPLEKLALHLAMQLTRSELQFSGAAIRNIVEHCITALHSEDGRFSIRLNPGDMKRYVTAMGESVLAADLVADASLSTGSVVLEAASARIEDLIEQRLASIVQDVLGDATAVRWQNTAPSMAVSEPIADASPPDPAAATAAPAATITMQE